jgi:release factor glutamine methyltransferase
VPAPPAHTDPAPGPAARALLAIRRRCYPLIRRLRRSRLAVKWWFGVRLPPGATVDYDTTTLALRRSLARWGRGVGSALEVGTGQAALLALYVARRFDLPVDAVDVSAARVASSRRAAELNRLAVRVWRSDLFAAVEGRYELIFSNPPYVPTATGRALGLTAGAGFDGDQVWDGGPDGTAVIGRLLAGAPERLLPGGVLLLGVQAFYVPDDAIRRLARGAGFEVASRERTPPLPSVVWVLRKG